MKIYENIILLSWLAYLLVWGFSAFFVKKDIRGGYARSWKSFWLLRIAAAALLLLFVAQNAAKGGLPKSTLALGLFALSPTLDWLSAALTVTGVAIAIWARAHLGRNWSPRPAAKEGHELVTSGPYAFVRHPIYTGLLLMALGTALNGKAYTIGIFIFACVLFYFRIGKEERIMHELFPQDYPRYRQRTKRLIPFLW